MEAYSQNGTTIIPIITNSEQKKIIDYSDFKMQHAGLNL